MGTQATPDSRRMVPSTITPASGGAAIATSSSTPTAAARRKKFLRTLTEAKRFRAAAARGRQADVVATSAATVASC